MPTSPVAAEIYYVKFFLNNQLVLSVSTWEGKPRIVFNVDKASLKGSKDKIKDWSYSGLKIIDHSVSTPLQGAISLNVSNLSTAFTLLNDPKFVKAIHQSNEKLISKGSFKSELINDEELAQLLLN